MKNEEGNGERGNRGSWEASWLDRIQARADIAWTEAVMVEIEWVDLSHIFGNEISRAC